MSSVASLVANFGNALQTTSIGGPFDSTLDLEVGSMAGNGQFSSIGKVAVSEAN
jgi:hypothetical protein